jgi:hypothetical protein
MPWKASSVMEERLRFVVPPLVSRTELLRGGHRPSWAGIFHRVIAARSPPLGDRASNNVLDDSIHTHPG